MYRRIPRGPHSVLEHLISGAGTACPPYRQYAPSFPEKATPGYRTISTLVGLGHLVVVAGLARRSARVAEIAVEDLEPVLVCYFARSCQQGYGSWDAKEGVAVQWLLNEYQ